ncbi:MAG TPA: hypothetical protein VEF06_12310 [Bryobacteraceae bacterium]|nr:hypothetical protein [Bryobacteraceae bacterium]
MRVVIRGNSVAAWCSVHLLKQSGLAPVFCPAGRPGVPAIMLSDPALALIRDIFGNRSLFASAHPIHHRVVQWGPAANALTLDHSAVVVSEAELLDAFGEAVTTGQTPPPADFTIFAARPLAADVTEHRFGTRVAAAAKISLKDPADSNSCWIESLEEGWLFLIPNATGSGWLLSVGPAPEAALAKSRLIGSRIASIEPAAGHFPTAPRIVDPLGGVTESGSAWLACGTAALAFDPLCGDGTAHAVREAILASAVVRGVAKGADPRALLAHYQARLTAGFCRHLAASLDFYRTGETTPWWQGERAALETGLAWCTARMREYGPFRYQLNNLDLVPLTSGK